MALSKYMMPDVNPDSLYRLHTSSEGFIHFDRHIIKPPELLEKALYFTNFALNRN